MNKIVTGVVASCLLILAACSTNDRLLDAVTAGDAALVSQLLEKGADPNSAGENGEPALVVAARKGDTAVARLLIEHGAAIDARDSGGVPVFTLASAGGHFALCRMLSDAGAAGDSAQNAHLIAAVRSGDNDAAKAALSQGASANAVIDQGITVLMAAAGNVAMTRMLIECGASVERKDKQGRTALFWHALRGSLTEVELLLAAGANVEATDTDGHTCLMYAAASGTQAVVEKLLAEGAPINAANHDGRTALAIAVGRGNGAAAVKIIRAGANVAMKGSDGQSAAELAREFDLTTVVSSLPEKPSSPPHYPGPEFEGPVILPERSFLKKLPKPPYTKLPKANAERPSRPVELELISKSKPVNRPSRTWWGQQGHPVPGRTFARNMMRSDVALLTGWTPQQYLENNIAAFVHGTDVEHWIYRDDDGNAAYLFTIDKKEWKPRYGFDFSSYLAPPACVPGDCDYVDQEVQWVLQDDSVLYVANYHRTYAKSSKGHNGYITALRIPDGTMLWRSDARVCNSRNFVRVGDYLICGYGFTREPDYLYCIDRHTGKTETTIKLDSGPEWIVHRDGRVFVYAYSSDYVFGLRRPFEAPGMAVVGLKG